VNDERFDVVVVGAGFGGAACEALLAKRGLRVALLEKNRQAGGKAMVVSKNGFTYDLWPVIHAPARESRCLAVLRELGLEERVELVLPPVRGAIYYDAAGAMRPFPEGPDPDPTEVFDLLRVAEGERERAVQVLAELTLLEPAALPPLDDVSFADWLEQKGTPRPVRTYLQALANGIFMVPPDLLAASEAIRTLQEILVRAGGLYCRSGGIGRLAELFAASVEENGGSVGYRQQVRRIVVEDGRVLGVETDDVRCAAPIVVSNAGLQPTVLRLVGKEHFDPGYVSRVKDLVPSWGMTGVRYFLSEPLLDQPFYLIFSEQAYWTSERWARVRSGAPLPREIIMWIQVPAVNEPGLAPPGRQCVLTGVWCSPDPGAPRAENERWWSKIDEIMERTWPGFRERVDARETYDAREVSARTRERALPGVGGECIGLGQVIGQCGRHKPSAQAPVQGLFFVGADAGGYGCGTHQAVDSGVEVAAQVATYHRARSSERGRSAGG
jgi:prolycopene isomerase